MKSKVKDIKSKQTDFLWTFWSQQLTVFIHIVGSYLHVDDEILYVLLLASQLNLRLENGTTFNYAITTNVVPENLDKNLYLFARKCFAN